jgi:hypothetical protein
MAFASLDDLLAGMASGSYRLPLTRGAISSAVAGSEMSLWRGTGFPAQGAVPAAAAICNAALLGALPLAPRSGSQERIISQLALANSASGHTIFIEDRLGHMGGLNGTLTTAQTVNLDIHASIGGNNLAERIGSADYSEIEWYLEWYTTTGSTVATPTAQCTFNDGSTASVNIWGAAGATALPASVAASRRYKLSPTNGKYIRAVQNVALSASTGTAGNFGVTAVRRLCMHEVTSANVLRVSEWSVLTAPKIADNACITFSQNAGSTTTGSLSGSIFQAVA